VVLTQRQDAQAVQLHENSHSHLQVKLPKRTHMNLVSCNFCVILHCSLNMIISLPCSVPAPHDVARSTPELPRCKAFEISAQSLHFDNRGGERQTMLVATFVSAKNILKVSRHLSSSFAR
jgi:hypothetical protein